MKKKIFKASGLCLAFILMFLMSAPSVLAAPPKEDKTQSGDDGALVMNKTAKLEDDGTYTIDLEAYATGTVVKETYSEVTPTDIVLVLDQSGSMAERRIGGIPGGYEAADPTHGEAMAGGYYYKDGENYYAVAVTRELVGTKTVWKGQDGKYYEEDALAYSWKRAFDQKEYITALPFVAASLKTYTRTKTGAWAYYVNDKDKNDTTYDFLVSSAQGAREEFVRQKKTGSTTVEFHNDGGNFGNWNQDNPYYAAAVYTAVTKETQNTYEYTYTYTNGSGEALEIGKWQGTDADKSGAELYAAGAARDGYRIDALKYAAGKFINDVRQNAQANKVDHRIAVVGFASEGSSGDYYYSNTELFVGAKQYNYAYGGTHSTHNSRGNLAEDHYSEAFQSVGTNGGYSNLIGSVNALEGYGATYPGNGFRMARGIYSNNTSTYIKADGTEANRKRIVIFLTDGEPGQNSDNFDRGEAKDTVTLSKELQEKYQATVYTVAVLDRAPGVDEREAFLKNTASSGSYTLATSTEALSDFFDVVQKEISSIKTTVTLDEEAILADVIGDCFQLPEAAEGNIIVRTAEHMGYESFSVPEDAPEGVTATVKEKTVSVTGFDFTSPENVVTTDESGGSVKATGNKLVLTIRGVEATDLAATGSYVSTNQEASGIYNKDSEGNYVLVQAFEQPMVRIENRFYVLDYAKKTSLTVPGVTPEKLDSAEDLVLSRVSGENRSLGGNYGSAEVSGSLLYYTPETMKWDGYDSFYVLGSGASHKEWAKASVIPANNVYYEDSFTSASSSGSVDIKYTGDWAVDGSEQIDENTAVSGEGYNSVHGWEESYNDDDGFSGGSAHKVTVDDETAASAEFTFTGTGVDVYTRTDMTAGTVFATLRGTEDSGSSVVKRLIVDNQSESGVYDQVPTVSFTDLEYGSYTVKISVTSAAEGRSTYYLDGIRIYNPIQGLEEEDRNIQEAYGDELGAEFFEVRDLLLDAGTLLAGQEQAGAVFIDKTSAGTGVTTEDIGTYEDFGPKNEVYLKSNQAIAFRVNDLEKLNYYIGLKSLEGSVSAQITNGEGTSILPIGTSSADRYYKVVPGEDGIIMIKNCGGSDSILAVSKLRAAGVSEGLPIAAADVETVVAYADSFDVRAVVAYSMDFKATEIPGDVTVTNPDPVSPVDFSALLERIFGGFRGWFKLGR